MRRYSDDERSSAIAALSANAGNIERTAAQLSIPESTLRAWATGTRHPEASTSQMCAQKKADLSDRLEALAYQLVDDMVTPARRKAASLSQLAVALGVAIDKARLLRGEATFIGAPGPDPKSLSDAQLRAEIESLRREGAGAAPGAASPGGRPAVEAPAGPGAGPPPPAEAGGREPGG
jgi:transposase-like protein